MLSVFIIPLKNLTCNQIFNKNDQYDQQYMQKIEKTEKHLTTSLQCIKMIKSSF
jgi:hypothetical protein